MGWVSSLANALVLAMTVISLAANDVVAQSGDRATTDIQQQDGSNDKTAKSQTGKSSSTKKNTARNSTAKNREKTAKKNTRLPGITPGREAAVMTFVRENHPDLEALLVYLKANRPADYEKAFRQLFATSERLARIQEQDDVRYELELARWKVQSRIQLLAARLQMEQNDELRNQIHEALNEQFELQIAILKRERQRLSERLEKLDGRIERLVQNKQQELDRQYRVLTADRARKAK